MQTNEEIKIYFKKKTKFVYYDETLRLNKRTIN